MTWLETRRIRRELEDIVKHFSSTWRHPVHRLVREHGKDRVEGVFVHMFEKADSGEWDEFDTDRAEHMMRYIQIGAPRGKAVKTSYKQLVKKYGVRKASKRWKERTAKPNRGKPRRSRTMYPMRGKTGAQLQRLARGKGKNKTAAQREIVRRRNKK